MAVKLVKPINYKNIEKITDADFEKQLKLLGVNSKFIVALSGGPDSLALLYLAKNFAKKNNLKFTAVSIDHNLREDSSKEIEWIKKLMKKEKVKSLLVNTVHDSIVADVYPGEEDVMSKIFKQGTSNVIPSLKEYYKINFNVPLDTETKIGINWLQMEDIK